MITNAGKLRFYLDRVRITDDRVEPLREAFENYLGYEVTLF